MSVLRQPEVLGQTTRRRVVGVTAALSAASIETLAVGIWFGLVVDSRTTSTALAGLGVLFCGSLLRSGVFGATVSDLGDLLEPRRLGVALVLTTGWVLWLLVAELVGDRLGIVIGTVVLTGILTTQFVFERHVFRLRSNCRTSFTPVVPALLMATGASILLVTAWFTSWSLSSPPITVVGMTVSIRIVALQIGGFVFGLFAFLAHQRRFQRLLAT
ncbi:hypothetical protein [Natrinema caseinilyticum]|uniref:hypothetical protein n=1 Tax=Natrinema caseinilyticum TaxID=2961570 RepID=UPI0020C2C3A1|nr:hypothetical protein [Natrinema caseinilyticum]